MISITHLYTILGPSKVFGSDALGQAGTRRTVYYNDDSPPSSASLPVSNNNNNVTVLQ